MSLQTIDTAMRSLTIGLVTAAVVAVAMATGSVAARAQDAGEFHELETKYIFGNFTVGSSIDEEGEKAFEPETEADFGKRGGKYGVSETELEFEYTPTQFMQVAFGPTVSYYNIHGVPGLDDLNAVAVNGFEAEFRPIIVDRGPSMPFAITASIEPEYHSRDETSGAQVANFGVENKLEADTELIKNRLFLAFNALYEPETTRDLGMWTKESTWGVSSALAYQIIPKVVVGADLWYLQHYDGLAFNNFTGDAVYLGPTFYWQIAPKILMSAAWQTQIAGREAGIVPANLDLADFSRQRARLLFEFEF